MRKAIVVSVDVNALGGRKSDQETEEALRDLNRHLEDGWNVVHSFPMSGTGHGMRSACIVILERES
jgi:hypothetical protein